MDEIEFDADEIDVAMQWHGGQSSMLYAMASTGALRRGIEHCRPRVDCDTCGDRGWISPSEPCGACRGAKMTDDQWLAYLAGKLANEAEESAGQARVRAKHAKRAKRYAEETEMSEHAVALDSIATKCRAKRGHARRGAVSSQRSTPDLWISPRSAARRRSNRPFTSRL